MSGKKIQIVSPGFLQEQNLDLPKGTEGKGGVTRIFILIQGKVAGSLALSDTIRPESYKAIKALQKRNTKCWMLTGDNK